MNPETVTAICAAVTVAGTAVYWILRAMIRSALADFKDALVPELRSMANDASAGLTHRVALIERRVFGEAE